MTWVRMYYNADTTVRRQEHRADEWDLGAAAYTLENAQPEMEGREWVVVEVSEREDVDGLIPIEALRVTGPVENRRFGHDVAELARLRQFRKDHDMGAGGRRDVLMAKLADDTIDPAEQRELMRIERGLG